jgi:hypothetical protein
VFVRVVFNICLERSFHFNYPCGTLCHLLLHPQLNYSRGEEVAALVTTLDFTDKKKNYSADMWVNRSAYNFIIDEMDDDSPR